MTPREKWLIIFAVVSLARWNIFHWKKIDLLIHIWRYEFGGQSRWARNLKVSKLFQETSLLKEGCWDFFLKHNQMSNRKAWSLLAPTRTGHMADIFNKHKITLNRWHAKHFVFCSTSQRRKQLTHKICHDILSQSALHLAVTFHNTIFLKWDTVKQSWSQTSPHQSLLVLCLLSFFWQQFSNFGRGFYCCEFRYQQNLSWHKHQGYAFPAAFCSGSSPLISCKGRITRDTNLPEYFILSN